MIMLRRRGRWTVTVAAAVVALAAAPPASADHAGAAQRRVAELKRAITALQAETARAVAAYEEVAHEALDATTRYQSARAAAEDADAALADASNRSADRVRAIYMTGGTLPLYSTLLESSDPYDLFSRLAHVRYVLQADDARTDRQDTAARRAAAAAAELKLAAAEVLRLDEIAQQRADEVRRALVQQQELLAKADAQVRRLLEEDRQKALRLAALAATGADPYVPSSPLTFACPVGSVHSFVDTWGAARSGGRRHEGTDVFAPRGALLYAVTDGVVDKTGNGGLGGITLWIRAGNGDRFYYAHNTKNLVGVGARVKAGQPVATVGDTGNARGTPPHLHFEAHPRGGDARNPYNLLKRICG